MRSGFVTLVGRPNVGKSTLLNQLLGTKVSIVSDKPQTTRHAVRGVLHRPGVQAVFVDTPGIHKPKTPLGEQLNALAGAARRDVDVTVFVVDARARIGPGDRRIAESLPADTLVVLNKTDVADRDRLVDQLAIAGDWDFAEYFPISALTGDGVDVLVDAIVQRLPEGPAYYPDDVITDGGEAWWIAELVREQLLAIVREELPHSIATVVTEWEWPHIRCDIIVERESQKGMVIGKGGQVLKQVGTTVREQLPEGAYLELRVRVEKNWQRRSNALERHLSRYGEPDHDSGADFER